MVHAVAAWPDSRRRSPGAEAATRRRPLRLSARAQLNLPARLGRKLTRGNGHMAAWLVVTCRCERVRVSVSERMAVQSPWSHSTIVRSMPNRARHGWIRDSEQDLQVQNPHLLTENSTVTLTAASLDNCAATWRGTSAPTRRGPWTSSNACMARPNVPMVSAHITFAESETTDKQRKSAGGPEQKAGGRPACLRLHGCRESKSLGCCQLKTSPAARSHNWVIAGETSVQTDTLKA
jgi:hypothetical protein